MGDGPPSLCDCVPMAGPAWPPGPRSEQLCPLHPQAAQPLGALVPRATPRPAGPTGQVLALALGQVTHLLSPRLLGVSASVPRRPSRICINPPEKAQRGRVSATSTPLPLLPGHPVLEARPQCPHRPAPGSVLGLRPPLSSQRGSWWEAGGVPLCTEGAHLSSL